MSKSIYVAAGLLALIVAYFGLRTLSREEVEVRPISLASAQLSTEDERTSVVVSPVRQVPHNVFLNLKGRTEPQRVVTVKSETTGTVAEAPVAEGTLVRKGTLLCGLGLEAREAQMAEAKAAVRSAELDYNAARQLADKGWAPEGQAASAKATLDGAMAARDQAELEIGKTRLRAPFAGVFERRMAHTGDFLAPGSECGMVVDLDPIRIGVDVAEIYAGRLAVGAPVDIQLSNGETLAGQLSFTARTANEETRTFRIVAETPNPDGRIPAGLSADLRISVGEAPASLISPGWLVLHDDGRIGVRHVDGDDQVQFAEVTVIDETDEGVWVTGLPQVAQVLGGGQDFVREGAKVITVTTGSGRASR